MSEERPEILVVARSAHLGEAVWQHLAEVAIVVGRLPPRLALVRLRDPATALPPVAGLVYLSVDDSSVAPPEALPEQLSPEQLSPDEQLFIDAWRTRFRPKQRAGDGLAWDEPGFAPPDRPRHTR